jgi:hypothetical protein
LTATSPRPSGISTQRRSPASVDPISKITNPKFLDGRFILAANNQVTFEVSNYDRTRPLVIDPVLSYSTYLGGSSSDTGYGIAVDSSGCAYVTGYTTSADFPILNPIQPSLLGQGQVFVSKLDSSGSALIYSTYLGGTGGDNTGRGVALDSAGNAYVIGETTSTDFPIVNPIQAANAGSGDAFVTKLDASGSTLMFSTYLGGAGADVAEGIAVDASGNAYIAGMTGSSDFPVLAAFQPQSGGFVDAFVTKLNPNTPALVYSTYLGGKTDDWAVGIAIDASRNTYVTGATWSTDFPTVRPLQPFNARDYDVFISKLDPSGGNLVYSTYLGGSGDDYGYGVAVDASGNAYVTGETISADFPTKGPLQSVKGWSWDAFVTKLNASGSALVYSTYLGGNANDWGLSIGLDSSANAIVAGMAESTDFPTTPLI